MSDTSVHIGQVRFELDVASLPRARAVSERVSGFGRNRLAPLLADVMADAAPPGQVLRLDSVVLDLGTLPEASLERRLGEALERALRAYLLEHGAVPGPGRARLAGPAPEGDAHWQQYLRLLAGAGARQAGRVLEDALRRWPLEALARLRAEGRKQPVRHHLALVLPPQAMEKLVRALEPGEAPLIVRYVGDVCALHRQRPLAPESRLGFRAVMWELVLSYLLLERGSYFNTRSMIGHTLLQMARRYRVAYAELLDRLTACLAEQPLPLADRAGLQAILLDLREVAPAQPPGGAPETGVPVARSRLESIAGFLERGVWRGSPAQAGARDGFPALMAAACDEDPDALVAMLRRAASRPAALRRLAGQLPAPARARLVHLLEPVHGAWIVGTVDAIGKVQSERQVVQDDGRRFGQRLWEFVFNALLVERGSVFNTRSFVRSLVVQLAAHYNMAYRRLLHALVGMAAGLRAPAAGAHSLPAILHWLHKEQARSGAAPSPAPDADQRRQLRRALRGAVLRHLLGAGGTPSGLRALLGEALRDRARQGGAALPAWLAAAIEERAELERLLLRREDLGAILGALAEELAAADAGATRAAAAPAREPAGFARAAREFVLRSFRIERGSSFNNRSYVDQLLHQLSARHGLTYETLLRGLIARAGIASTPAQTTLPGILLALKAETGAGVPRAVRPSYAEAGDADPVWRFLRTGQLAGGRGDALVRDGLGALDVQALAAALRGAANPVAMLERLIRYLPPRQLHALVEALATGAAGLAETWRLAVLAAASAARRPAPLEAMAWRAVLCVLLRRERGEFSASAFLAAATALLAPKLGLSSATLTSRLMAVAAARMGNAPRYRVLLDLLAQAGGRMAAPPAGRDGAAQPPGAAGALEAWLRYGGPMADGADPRTLLESLMAAHPLAARGLVLAAARRRLERHRLVALLSDDLRRRVLRLVFGAAAQEFEWWSDALAAAGGHGASAAQAALHALLAGVSRKGAHGAPGVAAWLDAGLAVVDGPARQVLAKALRPPMDRLPATVAGRRARQLDDAVARLRGEERTPAIRRPQVAEVEETVPEGEPFAVDNAGIVLLWPFLDRYFSMLGMVEDGAFRSAQHRHRAVELLRHLSHGELQAPEHAQLLNKVLCGIAPAEPLDAGGPLTDQERELSVSVLRAVTQNWDKLANTDAEGLQSTFLRREGSLVRNEDNWTLAVPRQAFDVLMGSLPWALGTIRLSWMRGILTVNWA
jgi:hypothetical protein